MPMGFTTRPPLGGLVSGIVHRGGLVGRGGVAGRGSRTPTGGGGTGYSDSNQSRRESSRAMPGSSVRIVGSATSRRRMLSGRQRCQTWVTWSGTRVEDQSQEMHDKRRGDDVMSVVLTISPGLTNVMLARIGTAGVSAGRWRR